MQYAIAHRDAVSNEIEIVRADGSVVYVQNDVEPLYDTHGDIYGCVSVCVDLTERKLRRDRAARRRPPEGRIPRHAVARAAQSARADPHGARGDAARAATIADARRKSARDDGAAAAAPGADHRRSARRGAHHAEQGRAAARAHRSARRAAQRDRSDAADDRRAGARADAGSAATRRSGSTPTSRGSRRRSRTC